MSDDLRAQARAVAETACGHPAWCHGFSSELEDAIESALRAAVAQERAHWGALCDDEFQRMQAEIERLRAAVVQERELCIADVANLTIIISGTDMACTETKRAAIAAITARGTT